MKTFAALLTSSFLIALFLSSCSDFGICTSSFNYVSARVLNSDHEPVVLDEFTVRDKKTGKIYDLCKAGECGAGNISGKPEMGVYTIMHDHYAGKINGERDLIVTGKNKDVSFQEEFTVYDDGCHITMRSGTNPVIIQ